MGIKRCKNPKCPKKVLRVISCKKYNAHTDPLFKNLELLKVDDLFMISKLKFYYKYINNKLPNGILQNIQFQLNQDIHAYNTRQARNMHVPRYNHSFAKNCLRYDLPDTINKTPEYICEKILTHSLQGFTKYVKNYFVCSYQDRCMILNCYICSNL